MIIYDRKKSTDIFISNRNTKHKFAILPKGNLQGLAVCSFSPGHILPPLGTWIVTKSPEKFSKGDNS